MSPTSSTSSSPPSGYHLTACLLTLLTRPHHHRSATSSASSLSRYSLGFTLSSTTINTHCCCSDESDSCWWLWLMTGADCFSIAISLFNSAAAFHRFRSGAAVIFHNPCAPTGRIL